MFLNSNVSSWIYFGICWLIIFFKIVPAKSSLSSLISSEELPLQNDSSNTFLLLPTLNETKWNDSRLPSEINLLKEFHQDRLHRNYDQKQNRNEALISKFREDFKIMREEAKNQFDRIDYSLQRFLDLINDDVGYTPKADSPSFVLRLKRSSRPRKEETAQSNVSKRSPVLGKTPRCNVSKTKLTELRNGIIDILNRTVTEINVNCELNLNPTDDCNDLVKVIQCGVNQIESGFLKALSFNETFLKEFSILKNAYDNLLTKYQKEIDEVIKSLSQNYSRQLEKSKNELQNLQKAMNNIQEKLRTVTKSLCASEIDRRKIKSAVKYFNDLNICVKDDGEINDILEGAYNYRNSSEVNFILDFILELPSALQKVRAYNKLYEILKKNEKFNCYNRMYLMYAVDKTVTENNPYQIMKIWSSDYRMNFWYMQNVQRKIMNTLKDECHVITRVISGAADGDFSYDGGIFRTRRDRENYDRLTSIVETAYDYKKPIYNFQNVMKFISSTPWYLHRAFGYQKMFEKLKESGEFSKYSGELLKKVCSTIPIHNLDPSGRSILIDVKVKLESETGIKRC